MSDPKVSPPEGSVTKRANKFDKLLKRVGHDAIYAADCYAAFNAITEQAYRRSISFGTNEQPTFWMTTARALSHTMQIVLGRLYDRKGDYRIETLLRHAIDNADIFERHAMVDRLKKLGITLPSTYREPKQEALERLAAEMAKHRKHYDENFKDLRDEVISHGVAPRGRAVNLSQLADLKSTARLILAALGLHSTLHGLFYAGEEIRFEATMLLDGASIAKNADLHVLFKPPKPESKS